MNYFDDKIDGKTSFKVLTLYMDKNEPFQFRNVSDFKIVKTSTDENLTVTDGNFTVTDEYLSFDYVSQATGEKNHAVFDCFGLFGVSYEVD